MCRQKNKKILIKVCLITRAITVSENVLKYKYKYDGYIWSFPNAFVEYIWLTWFYIRVWNLSFSSFIPLIPSTKINFCMSRKEKHWRLNKKWTHKSIRYRDGWGRRQQGPGLLRIILHVFLRNNTNNMPLCKIQLQVQAKSELVEYFC